VRSPGAVLERIAAAMSETLAAAAGDSRIGKALLAQMTVEWDSGRAL
jgi:hypothetical protein